MSLCFVCKKKTLKTKLGLYGDYWIDAQYTFGNMNSHGANCMKLNHPKRVVEMALLNLLQKERFCLCVNFSLKENFDKNLVNITLK